MFKRKKYNYEFRLKCVEQLVKKEESYKFISDHFGIEESNLRLWVKFYEQYGKLGLQPRKRQVYTAMFKLEVITAIEKDYLSLREACVKYNIPSESIIINWQRAYKTKGLTGLKPQPKGRPKMNKPIKRKNRKSDKPLTREEELIKENEYLRAENELLKKLQALVQKDKKQKP